MTTEADTITTAVVALPATPVSGVTFAFDLTITLGVIVTITVALIAWFRANRKSIDDRAASHSDRMDRHEGRIAAIEQTLNHMPAKSDVHNIQLVLAEVQGNMREIRTAFSASEARANRQDVVVQRVEDFLLKGKV